MYSGTASPSSRRAGDVVKVEEDLQRTAQAPNRATRWSRRQRPRADAVEGPRFQSVNMAAQPRPAAAIELLKQSPVQVEHSRVVFCDGGGGALGHPKVFLNLVPYKSS